jgi:cytidylate kinase
MQLICISRGTLSGGKDIAVRLAEKLDYPCLSREDVVEEAIKEGIQVGKIETAMMKLSPFSERLSLEKEHYVAFSTAYLCDRALKGPLVYHGRTGHLLFPGIANILRVRVIADQEFRLRSAMQDLRIDRDKARRYLEQVDEDRHRWVRAMYGVSWDDAARYDVTINLEHFNTANASSALTSIAQLPDFQMTPASTKALEDLQLAARARLLLARDDRTYNANFKVRVDKGIITVTFLPQDAGLAGVVPEVLASLQGVQKIQTTLATSNILWIQQKYEVNSVAFQNVAEIALKWDAAVELLRLSEEAGKEAPESAERLSMETVRKEVAQREYDGGIEDDVEHAVQDDDGGMKDTIEELSKMGRSGGGRTIGGAQEHLLDALNPQTPYTMVVVGDLFLSKGHAARVRMQREIKGLLSDKIKAPVVGTDELKPQFLFNKRDLLRLVGYLALVVLIYFLVFTNQIKVLTFLSATEWKAKALAAVAVFLFVPIVAYFYGTFSRIFLKLIKIE